MAIGRDLHELFEKYRRCVVCIGVDEGGYTRTASGIHIGSGYIVTAQHVVSGKQYSMWKNERAIDVRRTIMPENAQIDVAILETNYDGSRYWNEGIPYDHPVQDVMGEIQLGPHVDEAVGTPLVMTRILALGYPRIFRSTSPELVAVDGRVSSIIQRYPGPEHPYFIISVTPRGGFSGGPVISEYDFLLGVFTESLYDQPLPDEVGPEPPDSDVLTERVEQDTLAFKLGFAAALTVEPIYRLLADNDIYPGVNADLVREYRELSEPD